MSGPVTLWQRSQVIPAAPNEALLRQGPRRQVRMAGSAGRRRRRGDNRAGDGADPAGNLQRARKLRHFAPGGILADRLDVRIVAGETEAGLRLIHIGERRSAGHIALQRRAVGGDLGAVAINRAEQASSQEIGGNLQTVHQWADIAVSGLDGAAQFVILTLMTRKA